MKKSLQTHSTISFLVAYGISLYLLVLMMWPYLNTLVFATMLSGSFFPLRTWMKERLRLSNFSAAWGTLTVIIVTLFLPAIYLIVSLSEEAVNLFNYLKSALTEEVVENILFGEGVFGRGYLPNVLEEVFLAFNLEYNTSTIQTLILDWAKVTSSYFINAANQILGNLLLFLFNLVILLVVCFSVFLEGDRLKAFFHRLSPWPMEEEQLMVDKFNQMNYATLVGNGIGGLLQGGLAGLAFWWVGFESTFLWAAVMVFLAFIPMVGMSFIYVPAGIILLMQDRLAEGIGLLVFCTLVALWVEQWFKPKFVGSRVKIHSVLVFLSIIGGMSVFGLLGIFYGPLIISIFLTFVEIYQKRYSVTEATLRQEE